LEKLIQNAYDIARYLIIFLSDSYHYFYDKMCYLCHKDNIITLFHNQVNSSNIIDN